MKKTFLILTIALLSFAAAYVIAQSVNGQNWVGYVKVELPPAGDFIIVGVNFEAVGGGGVPLNEFINTNSLTSNAFPPKADNVFLYDTAECDYKQFYYDRGTFKNASQIEDIPAGTATNPIVHNGDAFWLKSSTTSAEVKKVYLLGEVSLDGETEQAMVNSFQLFANPYPTPLDMNDDSFAWISAGATADAFPTKADNIFIWNVEEGEYDQYFLDVDGKWHDMLDKVAVDAIIPVGDGAWYKAQGTFTNLFVRPYLVD